MACADSLRGDPAPRPLLIPGNPPGRPLRRRVGTAVQKAWRGYWRRRADRATRAILLSLDDRTLKDIGLDRSEVESVVYAGGDRRICVGRCP
jgi:uncharacterized protein YjiS (DUF1127 family)